MDSKTTLAAPVIQEVIDLVEDRLETSNPTDVSTVGPVDQGCTPAELAPTLLSAAAQAQGPDESESESAALPSANPPCNADGNDEDSEEETGEEGTRGEGEAAHAPLPTESGSHSPPPPVEAEASSSSSPSTPTTTTTTTTQMSPPGLAPPAPPAPPAFSQPLLPSQIMMPVSNAITRFKPSPRDVISGIAPHVFDERRRRRSSSLGRQGSGRRSSSPRWYGYRQGRPRASPLRMSVVISLDDRSIYIEDVASVAARLSVDIGSGKQQSRSDSKSISPSSPISPGKKMAAWTKFKLDGGLFKALVSRMKRRSPLLKAS